MAASEAISLYDLLPRPGERTAEWHAIGETEPGGLDQSLVDGEPGQWLHLRPSDVSGQAELGWVAQQVATDHRALEDRERAPETEGVRL